MIERKAREAVGIEPDAVEDPECGECGARQMAGIRKAPEFLQSSEWCDEIGRGQQRRLTAAFEWILGKVVPPPGLRHPSSEGQAREAFEAIQEVGR